MMIKKIALMIGACLIFSQIARADMYAVHGIHIDSIAQDAIQAKNQGVLEAQQKAFYKMLEKLTLSKDTDTLPALTNEDILNLVQDFSVSNEKTSSVRYIADIDVQFKPQAIQTFFQEYQVPYVSQPAEKTLILPVYQIDQQNQPLLWKDDNPWAEALSKAVITSELVPLIIPLGDLDDMATINEQNLNQETSLNLAPLLDRYQTNSMIFAKATLLLPENAIQVIVRPFQKKSSLLTEEIVITEPINAPIPEVLARTASRVVYQLEQAWREKNAVRFDNPTKLEVLVHINNLAEWISIRNKLDKITLIKRYLVKNLRKDQAQIEVFFVGDLIPFKNLLKKEGLFLSQKEGWILRNLTDVSQEEVNADLIQDEKKILDETKVVDEIGLVNETKDASDSTTNKSPTANELTTPNATNQHSAPQDIQVITQVEEQPMTGESDPLQMAKTNILELEIQQKQTEKETLDIFKEMEEKR